MAKNHEPENEDESSSGEEEETSSGEDCSSSEEDSEPEIQHTQVTKSESKSLSEPNAKAKASKPMDGSPKSTTQSKNPGSEPTDSQPVTPAKRPAEEKREEGKEGKIFKKKKLEVEPQNTPGASESSQKVPFQRLWSEADEIVILKGMLDYVAVKKSSPVANMDAFLDFIKKNLQADVHKSQLRAKITKLKKRYENSKKKYENNKLKNHELEAFELSHKIWGGGAEKVVSLATPKVNDNEVKKPSGSGVSGSSLKKHRSIKNDAVENKVNAVENGDSENVGKMDVADGALEKMDVGKWVGFYGVNMEEKVSRIGAELFEGENLVEGAKEWRKLLIEEMELDLQKLDVERARLDVKRARAKLVLDHLKLANH